MELSQYKKCSDVIRGLRKADFVLKNARIVNVFTEEIQEGDIAIVDGMIVGIGNYEGIVEHDVCNHYVCPGLIDSHLHLESTLVTPSELICNAAICGTTTFIVDPHESANVSGTNGIDYILEQTEEVPANVYVMVPSCVPSTEIDDNGYTLTAEKLAPYLKNSRILGLGEVMDYKAVITGEPKMHAKLQLFQNKVRDGHAPFLNDADLDAYVLAGISTDHECVEFAYAMQERRRGMTVLIREGSAAKNLEAIISGIVCEGIDTTGFCFCTDDKHIAEIKKEGHINYNVKKAISLGLPPMKAIKMATIQAAQCYGLSDKGAIAPGYQADLIVCRDLKEFTIEAVYHKGNLIQENSIKRKACPAILRNSVHISHFKKEDLILRNPQKLFPVIQMIDGQIITKECWTKIPGDNYFEPDETYQKIAVIERHHNTGKIGVGVVSGFGIRNGAIASSVSHDSHNIIVIGDNDEDIEIAVRELVRTQGGYTLIEHGKVAGTLELPIMGLLSDKGYQYVEHVLADMIKKAHEMGVSRNMDPFITLSFMALPVIPELRITPRGIYSVLQNELIKN